MLLTGINVLDDTATNVTLAIADDTTFVIGSDVKAYTSENKYTIEGSDVVGIRNIKLTNAGSGGLNTAVDDTSAGTPEKVTYNMTANGKTITSTGTI